MSNCCNHDDDCPNNPANWEDWVCGDCGTTYPHTVDVCTKPFDDYLAPFGGSIDAAITYAVNRGIRPLVDKWRRREANGEWKELSTGTWRYSTFEDPLKSLYTVNYNRLISAVNSLDSDYTPEHSYGYHVPGEQR